MKNWILIPLLACFTLCGWSQIITKDTIQTYIDNNTPKTAYRLLKRYQKQNPDDIWGLETMASLQMQSGYKFSKRTCALYYELYQADTNRMRYFKTACKCAKIAKDDYNLLDWTKAYLKRDSTDVDMYLLRAVALKIFAPDTVLVEYYRKLQRKFPNDPEIVEEVYTYLESTGRCVEAFGYTEELEETNLATSHYWFRKAECFYSLSRLEEACDCYVNANKVLISYIPKWRQECVDKFPGKNFPK